MNTNSMDLSIIITLYNRRDLGLRALESVLIQNSDIELNFEIIIVDDGSEDNPLELLKKHINNSTIRYFYKENGGPASAKNFGAKKAHGKYIFFLDSDDYLKDKEALSELPNLIKKDPDLIAGSSMIVLKNGGELYKEANIPTNLYDNCLKYPLNYVGVHPYIFKRSSYLKHGGLNEQHRWGDAISFWRIFTKNAKVSYLNQPIYVYDQSGEASVSRSRKKGFYVKVLTTISESYEISKNEIDLRGYTFNWGIIILALSVITFNKKLFFIWAQRCLLSPIESLKSLIYVIRRKLK